MALKTNLAHLKTEVDKLDIDELVPVPNDLSKLSNGVKNDVIKKTDNNAKITEIENKIPNISNLATKTSLNTFQNKIANVSSLVKKTNHETKVTEIENKLNNHNRDKYCNWIRTQNQLVQKRILNHLAKLHLNFRFRNCLEQEVP